MRRLADEQIDGCRQTERQIDRQIDREMVRQMSDGKWMDGWIDKQRGINRWSNEYSDRQTLRHTNVSMAIINIDKQTNRYIDIQIDRWMFGIPRLQLE